jgi:hypothetical protein
VPVYHQTDPANEETRELYTGTVQYAIYRDGETPGPYTPAVIRSGKTGILIQGLTPGVYRVRAKVTGETADQPVIDCGTFTLSR